MAPRGGTSAGAGDIEYVCGSLVGQFIIGFKLGIGAAEYAPAAAVSIAKAESLMVCRAMLVPAFSSTARRFVRMNSGTAL